MMTMPKKNNAIVRMKNPKTDMSPLYQRQQRRKHTEKLSVNWKKLCGMLASAVLTYGLWVMYAAARAGAEWAIGW